MKYIVRGCVTIILALTEEFEDNGEIDLMAQAKEALEQSDEIPLSRYHDIVEVEVVTLMEVSDEA